MRSGVVVWRRLCQSLEDVHAGQVTTYSHGLRSLPAERQWHRMLHAARSGEPLASRSQPCPASAMSSKLSRPVPSRASNFWNLLSGYVPASTVKRVQEARYSSFLPSFLRRGSNAGSGSGGGSVKATQLASDPRALRGPASIGGMSGDAGVPFFGWGKHVVRPVAFTAVVTCGAFGWALCRDEDNRNSSSQPLSIFQLRSQLQTIESDPHSPLQPFSGPAQSEARLRRHERRAQQAPEEHRTAMQWACSLPLALRPAAMAWAAIPDPSRTLAAIVAVNVAVCAMWRVPLVGRLMERSFSHTPGAGRSYTLLTSAFSHRGIAHLAANMVVLWSFGASVFQELGREQFLAVYTSAAVISGLASHLWAVLPIIGKNIPGDRLLAKVRRIRPSLGASGAVIAIFAIIAARQPDRQVSFIFAPFYSFGIGTGFLGMVALDLTGTVLRWGIFDHQAHLGGAAWGSWYARWGTPLLWNSESLRHRALAIRDQWRHLGDEPEN